MPHSAYTHRYAWSEAKNLFQICPPLPTFIPCKPLFRLCDCFLAAQTHHHVIPEAAQLVVIGSTLQECFHTANLFPSAPNLLKKRRSHNQFFFVGHRLPYPLPQIFQQHLVRTPV